MKKNFVSDLDDRRKIDRLDQFTKIDFIQRKESKTVMDECTESSDKNNPTTTVKPSEPANETTEGGENKQENIDINQEKNEEKENQQKNEEKNEEKKPENSEEKNEEMNPEKNEEKNPEKNGEESKDNCLSPKPPEEAYTPPPTTTPPPSPTNICSTTTERCVEEEQGPSPQQTTIAPRRNECPESKNKYYRPFSHCKILLLNRCYLR